MPANKKQEKIQRLTRGLEIAEAAVALDGRDARAHLAIICNLGRQVELAGLSWRVFGQVRRLQAEADLALELAPDDPDILTTKGQMMRQTPGPLGGSKEVGLKLLQRAVEVKPDHVTARLYLAQAMADDGAPDARKRLYEVLALAKERGAVREQTEAQQLLASLDD
jgi:cytochrome c-type biogenesis protein CcmH/NrfG